MTTPTYTKHVDVNLKTNSIFNEAWLHERIKDDPTILGLGDVRVLDHERAHVGGGRLDLLLYSEDDNRRYEVEVMLGATDPSHIIRTIEYWDIERRRYPGYEHVAVLIAEDITSRFLNVMSLLSGNIPFIALQLSALQVDDKLLLHFVRVLDQTALREDDTVQDLGGGQVDRSYWEKYAGPQLMTICDDVLTMVNAHVKTKREFNFLEQYIGLRGNGVVDNFMWFGPRKKLVHLGFRTSLAPELKDRFDQAALPTKIDGTKYVKVSVTAETLRSQRALIEQAIIDTIKDNDA